MKRVILFITTFMAGFLLYSAWAGYIEDEFKATEYRGHVFKKIRSEQVIDMGSTMITQPAYNVVFSTGKVIPVPYSIFQKLNKGDYAVLIKQKDQILYHKIK